MIEAYIRTQDRVQFSDVSRAMLDSQGRLRRGLYGWDPEHMSLAGFDEARALGSTRGAGRREAGSLTLGTPGRPGSQCNPRLPVHALQDALAL